jgi:hypothetical protein
MSSRSACPFVAAKGTRRPSSLPWRLGLGAIATVKPGTGVASSFSKTVNVVDLAGVGSLSHESAIRPHLIWSRPFRAGPRYGGEPVDPKSVTPVQCLLRDANQSCIATGSLNTSGSYSEGPVM